MDSTRREKIKEDIARCDSYIKKYQDRKRADMQRLKNMDRDEIHELWKGLSMTREEAEEAIRTFKQKKDSPGDSNEPKKDSQDNINDQKKEARENEKKSD